MYVVSTLDDLTVNIITSLEEVTTWIKIRDQKSNYWQYTDDITWLVENKEELEGLIVKTMKSETLRH